MTPEYFTFKLRRGLAVQWSLTDPILNDGEPGVESDTGNLKLGDGIHIWTDLPYVPGEDLVDSKIAEAIAAIPPSEGAVQIDELEIRVAALESAPASPTTTEFNALDARVVLLEDAPDFDGPTTAEFNTLSASVDAVDARVDLLEAVPAGPTTEAFNGLSTQVNNIDGRVDVLETSPSGPTTEEFNALDSRVDTLEAAPASPTTTEFNALEDRVEVLEDVPPPDSIDKTIIDAKGDLIIGTADNVVARLPIGTDEQILSVDSSTATGLRWITISEDPAVAPNIVSTTHNEALGSTVSTTTGALLAGDVLIVYGSHSNNTCSIVVSSSGLTFSSVAASTMPEISSHAVWASVIPVDKPSGVTVTLDKVGGATTAMTLAVLVVRGADPESPLTGSASVSAYTSSATPTAPSITPGVAPALVVNSMMGWSNTGADYVSSPTVTGPGWATASAARLTTWQGLAVGHKEAADTTSVSGSTFGQPNLPGFVSTLAIKPISSGSAAEPTPLSPLLLMGA
jgi:hypothetical protein